MNFEFQFIAELRRDQLQESFNLKLTFSMVFVWSNIVGLPYVFDA